MTATPITSEQAKQFKRFVEDAVDRALKEAAPDKDSLQELFSHGGEFQAYVREGIRKFSTKRPAFPIYLDAEVGGKSKDELLAELKSNGNPVSDWAKDIMSKPAWKSGEREQVKFGRAMVRELGFTKSPTTTALWARIREVGDLCEPGDGPSIRRALKNQPRGDCFWVAMEQIAGSDRGLSVFIVGRDGSELWVSTGWAGPRDTWNLDDEVVFRLRK